MRRILKKINNILKRKKQKYEWTMANVTEWRKELQEAYERGDV